MSDTTKQKTTGDQSPAIASGGGDVDVRYDNRKKIVVAGSAGGMIAITLVAIAAFYFLRPTQPTPAAVEEVKQLITNCGVPVPEMGDRVAKDIDLLSEISETIREHSIPVATKLLTGKFDAAEEELAEMLTGALTPPNRNKRKAAAAAFALGGLSYLGCEYGDAFENYTEALRYEDRREKRIVFLGRQGDLQLMRGNLDEAERIITEALELSRQPPGNSLKIAGSLNDLGRVSFRRWNFEEAERQFTAALAEMNADANEEPSHFAANIYNNLGAVYDTEGDCSKAIAEYRKALAIYEKRFGDEFAKRREVANTRGNLGVALFECDQFEDAVGELQEAIAIRERNLDGRHPSAAWDHFHLAEVLFVNGDKDEAFQHYEQSEDILRAALGPTNEYTLMVAGVVASRR